MVVDLNADVGEAFGVWSLGADEEVFRHVTSANVACGFHAGDPLVMDRTVGRALQMGVAVGAHPGHPDLRGFGRRRIDASPAEVEADVLYQVGALAGFVKARGGRLAHVKPHGALYNQAAGDEELARALARAVARFDAALVLVGLAGSGAMRRAASEHGLRFAGEAFADRRYEADGTLVSRREADAVIDDAAEAAAQAVLIAREHKVLARDGRELTLPADTLCVHADAPGAAVRARTVREALDAAGVAVRALAR